MIAPLPASETTDSPYKLIATILAQISEPQGRLKAAALRVEIGTEQDVCVTIVGLAPSQEVISVSKVEPSSFLIVMM